MDPMVSELTFVGSIDNLGRDLRPGEMAMTESGVNLIFYSGHIVELPVVNFNLPIYENELRSRTSYSVGPLGVQGPSRGIGKSFHPGLSFEDLYESYQELLVRVEDMALQIEDLLEEKEK